MEGRIPSGSIGGTVLSEVEIKITEVVYGRMNRPLSYFVRVVIIVAHRISN
jgi:hypothetical protein